MPASLKSKAGDGVSLKALHGLETADFKATAAFDADFLRLPVIGGLLQKSAVALCLFALLATGLVGLFF